MLFLIYHKNQFVAVSNMTLFSKGYALQERWFLWGMLLISFYFFCYSNDFCRGYSLRISLSSLCIPYSEEGSEDVLFGVHHCLSPGQQNERIYFIWPNCLVPRPSDCFLSNCLEVKLLQRHWKLASIFRA